MEERMDVKRTNLNTKFAKLEAQMGQLKSEQDYLTKQMAGLG